MDFRISEWISGFQSGFLDFRLGFWISQWISGFQFGFLPTVYEISFVTDPSDTSYICSSREPSLFAEVSLACKTNGIHSHSLLEVSDFISSREGGTDLWE